MKCNNEAKLKEQNSSRLTDSKGPGLPKGRSGEGGRRGLRGIMFSTHGVGDHGENSVAQGRDLVELWQLAALMDSDCTGVWVGT